MAQRNDKNSKEEWRRRKKLREQQVKAAEGRESYATAEEIKARFFEIGKKLSPAEKIEFEQLMDERMRVFEDGELPPFDIDLNGMASEARTRARLKSTRQYLAQPRPTSEEDSVDSYLEMMSYALKFSRAEADPERRAEMLRAYMVFREARVFHIGPETYIAVHQEADRYTTELAGLDYQPGRERKEIPKEENDKYLRVFFSEGKRQPYPEHLPFPNIYLGYGSGVGLPEHTISSKAPSQLKDRLERIYIVGHHLSADGYALNCFRGTVRNDDGTLTKVIWCEEAHSPDYGWARGMDLEPWTLPHLIRLINEHRTFVLTTELSGALRRDIKQNRKELGLEDYKHMPKPYYSLRLESKVIRDKVRKQLGRPPSPRLYKTDVRGHERCRIWRGPLPIDPELAAKLLKRDYKLFTTNALDPETYQRLAERGLAYKRSDEWLAVKASWVKDHMSSTDPDLPYVPAVRRLGNVRVRPCKPLTGAWTEDPAAG